MITACFLITFAARFLYGETPLNVILLNSYHKGFLWTDEITMGVEDTFRGKGVELHVEYLDTKQFFSPEYFSRLTSLLAFKHSSRKYDLLLLSDNNAVNFYTEWGRSVFGNIPVVFCGYNNFETGDLKGFDNITGVNERVDIEDNLRLIEEMNPDVSRILLIADDTVTGQKIISEAKDIISKRSPDQPKIELVHTISSTELVDKLRALTPDTAVFLTAFFRDSKGEFFEYDVSTEMITSASPVPVYGTWDFNLGHGIVGGYLIKGYQQGAEAAQMALTILGGKPVSEVPPKMDTPVQLYLDFGQLERFGYDINKLPKNATIVNWPDSFFRKYRTQITIALSLTGLFILVFFSVLFGFIKARTAEREIRKHETDLRTTLNSIGDGVISTDLNQEIVRMNPVAEILTGWHATAAKGMVISEVFRIFNTLTDEPEENPVHSVLESGKIIQIPRHTTLKARNGREYRIADSVAPILDDEGEVTGVVLVFRNVSEEYRIQEELLKERAYVNRIISNSPSLICGLDRDGITVFINPVIEKITGYREEEVIGKNFWKHFYPGEEFNQVKKLLSDSVEGVVVDYEMSLTCKNGEKRNIVWNSFSRKDKDGEITGYLGFGYDITRLKNTENQLFEANQELIRHKNNLEELVAERTMELEISLDHLQQTQQKLVESEKMAALGALVAGVAHEINTPVGIGVTAASHLEEKVVEFGEKFLRGEATRSEFEAFLKDSVEGARMILVNMKRAAELIQSFKQVAVDQSSQEIRTFSIEAYMEEILLSLRAKLRLTSIEVVVNCPEDFKIKGNPGALSQIITNLIMNSITHGFDEGEPGTITIDVRKSDDHVLIIYGDTGKGIPENNLKRIFEPFFTTRRGKGGSGLGMNIVYNLVTQSLGGQISCSSTVGEGTWFEIEFPVET